MSHSISELIQRIQKEPTEAAHELWDRFIDRLINAAHNKLRNYPRRMFDEEDVALSAFDAFLRGAKEGRFKKLESRDDLWQVLAMLTERKAIAVVRRELALKRGGGQVRGESVFEKMLGNSSIEAGLLQVGDPNPQVIEIFTVEVRERLEQLGDERLRDIAMLKYEGFENREIAEQLGIALRSVERKLKLIRNAWGE